jgi:hypothetical protein
MSVISKSWDAEQSAGADGGLERSDSGEASVGAPRLSNALGSM